MRSCLIFLSSSWALAMSTSFAPDLDLIPASSSGDTRPNPASAVASSSQTILHVDLLVRSEKRSRISLLP